MIFKKFYLGILIATAMTQSVYGQEGLVAKPLHEGRPCSAADVVGLWETVSMAAAEASAAQVHAQIPHDYLRFSPNGKFIYFGAKESVREAAKINSILDMMDKSDGVSYVASVKTDGLLKIERDGRFFQGFTCTILSNGQASGEVAMIWTELEGFPALRRVQVRIR